MINNNINGVIYAFFYKPQPSDAYDICCYIGKTENITERIQEHHLQCLLNDPQHKLYSFINSIGGFSKIYIKILHSDINDPPMLAKYERDYYNKYDQKYLMNACLPILLKEPITDQMSHGRIVDQSDIVHEILTAYKNSIVKQSEMKNANLYNKYRSAVTKASNLTHAIAEKNVIISHLQYDKKNLQTLCDDLSQRVNSLDVKLDKLTDARDKSIERINMLSDKLFDKLEESKRINETTSSVDEVDPAKVVELVSTVDFKHDQDSGDDLSEYFGVSSENSGEEVGGDILKDGGAVEIVEKGKKKCTYCNEIITSKHFSKHLSRCKIKKEIENNSTIERYEKLIDCLRCRIKQRDEENKILKAKVELLVKGEI